MEIDEHWKEVKQLFGQSFKSSFHFSIATVDENGEPHLTPIGSLILGRAGRGFYFDEFTMQSAKNFQTNNRVCVLAVNSSRWFWLKSLIAGKFASPPAVRLYGTVGELREVTAREKKLWHTRVKPARFTKGYRMMWANMRKVREIEFSRMEPVRLGELTRDAWHTKGN